MALTIYADADHVGCQDIRRSTSGSAQFLGDKLVSCYGSPYQSQQCSTHQSSTPLSITYPSNEYQQSIHHNVYSPSSSIPQLEYAPSVNQQSEFSQPDSGLIVPVFQKGDDPIDAINHMMSFLTAVVTSRYPTTNNQLRNSSNPRQQATINDGRVTVQPVQGRQISYVAGTTRTFTPRASGNNSGKQRIVTCYNCKGEGHMSKQCTKPRRKRDDSWFKDKVLLVQAQASGQILHEEELAFLADPGILEVAFMANLSHYGSDALFEVHSHDNVNNNIINQAVQAMLSSEQSNVVNHSKTEITSDSNIIPYSQYLIESQQPSVWNSNSFAQQDALILSVIEQLNTQVANCTKINLDNKTVNDTLTAELERYKEQVKVLNEGQNVDLTIIMEYLVNISKRRAFWSLNEDILKITILKTNTPYPSRKIRRIRACTHQRPQRNKAQYAVSREDQYAVLEIWNEYNILEDIKHGPYSKKSSIRPITFRCADNRPLSVDKDMYDSWKSRMKLYMMNRQHGRMILKSVENGPLIWPTIEENGVTRPRKYSELSATWAIQADCDVKATNIIL
ncbi:uncharacterized mitochondrial protein-like protein [Tanacetum coccineum]